MAWAVHPWGKVITGWLLGYDWAFRGPSLVSMTLPSIDFFRDGKIGTTVATVCCNIPRRIRGQRSTVGPVLQLPLEAVHERSAKIMMLYGVLKLAGENEGITIPAQSFVINDTQLRIPMTEQIWHVFPAVIGPGQLYGYHRDDTW